jgi:hypothetical protein
MLIDRMFVINAEKLIFGTPTDLYYYDPNAGLSYLTPIYSTGTVAVSGTTVTGTGTGWTTPDATTGRNPARVGDEIAFTDNAENDPEATWYKIDAVGSGTSLTLHTSAGTVDSGHAYTIRQKFTNRVFEKWSTDVYTNAGGVEDLWFGTNGVDPIVAWNGVDTSARWANCDFKAKRLRVFQNMMIYGAVTTSGTFKPTSIINSDNGDPEAFASGLSGEFIVRQGFEEISRLEPLGDNLIAYGDGKATQIQFVGDPVVFAFRQILDGIGPLGSGYIANFGDYHEFASRDGQYRFDGVSSTLISKHVWREILRTSDPARKRMAFTHFNQEAGEVVWATPLVTDTDVGEADGALQQAYVEAYLEEVPNPAFIPYSRRAFPFISAGYTIRSSVLTFDQVTTAWKDSNFRWNDQFFFAAFPLSICGDENGRVWILDGAQTGADDDLPGFVTFGRRVLGDERTRGLLARIYPFAAQFDGDLTVTSMYSDHADGAPTIVQEDIFDMNLVEGGHFVTPYRRGRFFEVQFGTPGNPWQISGYDIDARSGGKR